MSASFSEEFYSSLSELTSNRRPLIDMLTMLAEDYYASAPSIVTTIEYHLTHVVGDKLATLYLIDSIVKNVGRDYVHLFAQNLPTLFTMVFSQADARMKTSLHKLRVTWDGLFPSDKLLVLDSLVHDKDPGWPVSLPPQPTNIHINPDFIKGGSGRHAAVKGDLMKERILQEKKVLLELQKKKVELELLQTKEVLEKEQKKLLSFTITRESKAPAIVPEQRNLPSVVERIQSTSSSRDVDVDNSKKLLELSIRDPRRKSRQNEVANSSPISGTSSPLPVKPSKIPEPETSSICTNVDFSDDSRERPPPKKKSRYKDKKNRRDKDSSRERKVYKPRAADSSKNNNGFSYEPSNTNNREYEDMETVEENVFTFPSENDKVLPEDTSSKTERTISEPVDESSKNLTEITSAASSSKSVSDSLLKSDLVESSHKVVSDNIELSEHHSDIDIRQSVESSLSELFETGKPTVITRDPRLADSSKMKATGQQVGASNISFGHDDRLPNTSALVHSLPHSDLSKSSNSTDSSDVNVLSVSSQKTDLISNLSNTLSNEGHDPIERTSSPSHNTSTYETSDVRSIDSNTLFEELKNSDEDSGSNIISKITVSKRKCDSEDDKENHKKILLSQLKGEDSSNETQPLVASPTPYSENKSAELHLNTSIQNATPPLIAPPPPIIPPLVAKSEIVVESSSNLKGAENDSNLEESNSHPQSSLVIPEETVKDVDLRLLLPRPIERAKEEVKVDVNVETTSVDVEPITLFGGEDVDYRQKPPQAEFNLPSPPPPPVIGNLQEATSKKSWAQIKDRKSEDRFSSPKIKKTEEMFPSPKVKPDRSKRTSFSHSRSNISNKEISRQNSQEHCNLLIKDAEEQLRNGNITFVEYNKMLQEVVSINEERILKEARARYSNTSVSPERESELASPISENDGSFESEISDRPGEIKKASQQIETKVVEPSSELKLSEMPDDRFKNQSVEKRFAEPPSVSSLQPQFPGDFPFREGMERDRFQFPDRGGFLPGRGGPSSLNVTDNFPLPQGLGRSMPLPQFPLFPPPPNMPFQGGFRPRMSRDIAPRTLLPPAEMDLLMEAENNRMETITIGGSPKQIRFYGMTAVVLQSWDDPREVCFPPDKRSLLVDQRHEFVLQFGDAPTEIIIDGMSSLVQLGAPNREIYIDNKYYSMSFGGISFEVLICGRIRSICLPGPPPVVSFSPLKRTDLVAGTVNLYINAKSSISLFLDATPQKFYIDREPCVLQFADALMTVLINGVPVPLQFGGFPVPVMVRGVLHFLRLTCLPVGINPGRVNIANMISYVQPQVMPTLPPLPVPPLVESTPAPPVFQPPQVPPMISQQPLDLLANIISSPAITSSSEDRSYTAEQPSTVSVSDDSQPSTVTTDSLLNININDLLQRLIKNGMLPNHPEEKQQKDISVIETEVDFTKPDSLKLARPSLVTKLYSGIQCSSCGVRFPPEGTKMYSRHLDWHFRQNRREKHSTRKPQSRNWYYSYSNWLQYQELDDVNDNEPDPIEEEIDEDSEEDIPSVPVGRRKNVACQVCGETFEEFFDHETEEWQARNAIMVEELFYHPLCYEEFKTKKESRPADSEEKLDYEEEGPPLDDPSTVEVIDLDDTEVPSPVSSHDSETLPLLEPEKVDSPDVIAVDDTSDSKSSINEVKPDETQDVDGGGSEDDDILAIIPIERKIDTYDLIDDDDDDKVEKIDETINIDDSKTDDLGQEDKEEDFDFTKVTIKQEKDRLVLENVDSSLPTYTATIDGNIVHESAVQPIVPGRIKINIHRSKQIDGDAIEPSCDSNDGIALNQPLPPGEETVQPPLTVKSKLMGVEFTPQPSVNQGSELSGLCSIM